MVLPLVLAGCLAIIALGSSAVRLPSSEARTRGTPPQHQHQQHQRRLDGEEDALEPESTFADPSLSHRKPQPRRDSAGAIKLSAGLEVAPPSPAAPSMVVKQGASPRRAAAAGRAAAGTGDGSVLARLRTGRGSEDGGGTYVRVGAPKEGRLTLAELRALRKRFHGRKFLFPLLDQGPNNQFLQFRVALQRAHALNRTLVLPIWLPHNPKFQHFHPGAPLTPSRDKRLDQLWYPFETAFDARSLRGYARTIPLETFRQLTGGKLERCLAHTNGFESYLRLSRISCASFAELPEDGGGGGGAAAAETRERLAAAKDVRFLGFHQYDHELGTRDRYYEYVRWSAPVLAAADELAAALFKGFGFLAAHVRLPDAHWERNDCKHTINGLPAHSVSCGDPERRINHTSIATEIYHALRMARSTRDDATDGGLHHVYLASNMNCSDARVAAMSNKLQAKHVLLVCAQARLLELAAHDQFVASLVEQEMCSRAQAFVGSKYSTWTDTVNGVRAHAKRSDTSSFEDLWAMGVGRGVGR